MRPLDLDGRRAALVTLMVAALWMALAAPASAQGQTEGARPMGMGSAFTANASGNGALYHNPAGVGTIFIYSVEGAYVLTPGMNGLNVSVVDSKLNPKLSAGAAYTFEFASDPDSKLTGHDGRLALASQVIPDLLVLGVGGRYMLLKDGKDELVNGFTLDVGTVVKVSDGFFIGVSGNNLIDPCQGRDEAECPTAAAPRSVGGGLSFGSSAGFQLSADVRADFSPGDDVRLIYAVGAEALLGSILALRAGYQHRDLEKENVLALGGGLKTEGIGLDVGYQRRFDAGEDLLAIAIQFYFF